MSRFSKSYGRDKAREEIIRAFNAKHTMLNTGAKLEYDANRGKIIQREFQISPIKYTFLDKDGYRSVSTFILHIAKNAELVYIYLNAFHNLMAEGLIIVADEDSSIEELYARPKDVRFVKVDIKKNNLKKVSFNNFASVEYIDLTDLDTSNVVDMYSMFNRCRKLKKIDFGAFSTINVTTMKNMFGYCTSLEDLNLSSFNTCIVHDMTAMFYECKQLEGLDLLNFDTSNVTDMSLMFYDCNKLKYVMLENFNTHSVVQMDSMFAYCYSLSKLDLAHFDFSSIESMEGMFYSCVELKELQISPLCNVKTNVLHIFDGCKSLPVGTKIEYLE